MPTITRLRIAAAAMWQRLQNAKVVRFCRHDVLTARHRLRELRHPAVFRAVELVVGGVALVWGVTIMAMHRQAFGVGAYAAFNREGENMWGVYFVSLGLAIVYAALTRTRWQRVQVMGVTALSFAIMVTRMWESGQATTGPAMYSYLGVVLPVAVGLYLFVLSEADDHIKSLDRAGP